MAHGTVAVTDASFETDVLKSAKPVLLDFWADWCGPCKQLAPVLEQVAAELGPAVTVAKMDTVDSPLTPSRYGVKGIPTLMIFRDGQMASMKVGAMPRQRILDWLAENGISASAVSGATSRA